MIDKTEIKQRLGGDSEFLAELRSLLGNTYPKQLAEIKGAIADNDASSLEKVAHSLKGAVANFGPSRARDLAMDLEVRGRENRMDGAEPIYEQLEKAAHTLFEELGALVREWST